MPQLTDFIHVGTNDRCPASNEFDGNLFIIMNPPHVFAPVQQQTTHTQRRQEQQTDRLL